MGLTKRREARENHSWPHSTHFSGVVPVYKAERCLDELNRRLRFALEQLTHDFEIILMKDCGSGRSWEIINRLARDDRGEQSESDSFVLPR
jgi:hypothetical protein